jgi:hypothetical protein
MIEPPLVGKRMAISARRTFRLRVSGLEEILEKVRQKRMQDPSVYGRNEDYNRLMCWGADGGRNASELGIVTPSNHPCSPSLVDVSQSTTGDKDELTSGDMHAPDNIDAPSDSPIDGDATTAATAALPHTMAPALPSTTTIQHPKLSECLTVVDGGGLPSAEKSTRPPPDFGKYGYRTRTEDREKWLGPNPKAITSRKSLAGMMMTKHVTGLLAKEGLIPVIVSPDSKNKKSSVRTPFGPLLDANNKPVKPGTMFLATTIYSKFGLKKGKGFNDAWTPEISQCGCGIFRLAEKNGLPTDEPIPSGMSPLGELLRIVAFLLRIGFYFFGSGGVPVVNGFVSPSANSKAATDADGARNGATFETAQTVDNRCNYTMDQLCERGPPIPMFLAGKALPREYYDESLFEESEGEQVMYLGPYRTMQCAQEEPLEMEDINKIVSFYKPFYALESSMLRFHLEYRKKYKAVPVSYTDRTYKYIEIDTRDDRKPLFEVADSQSYLALLSTQATNCISEKQMIEDWILEQGHMELVDSPYLPPGTSVADKTLVHPRPSAGTLRRPMGKRMAHQSKRKITFAQHWFILLKASVAAYARQLEVHIDVDRKIGPLIDSCPTIHTAGSELANYSHYFGVNPPHEWLSHIGPEFQKASCRSDPYQGPIAAPLPQRM